MKIVRINIIPHHRRRHDAIHLFKHIPLQWRQPQHPVNQAGLYCLHLAIELPHHLVRPYNPQPLILQSLHYSGTEKLQLTNRQHNAGNTAWQILNYAVRNVQIHQKAHHLLVLVLGWMRQNHGEIRLFMQQTQ